MSRSVLGWTVPAPAGVRTGLEPAVFRSRCGRHRALRQDGGARRAGRAHGPFQAAIHQQRRAGRQHSVLKELTAQR